MLTVATGNDQIRASRELFLAGVDVRLRSQADMCGARTHVRFTPNSDRESRLRAKVMSAFTPKVH
jgi:hypothetical protein